MKTNPTILKRIGIAALGLTLIASTAACTTTDAGEATDDAQVVVSGTEANAEGESIELVSATPGELALFDSSTVHDIEIEFDQDAYDAMIATYETTGDKDWIEATITIDGTTIDNIGIRLKGNSSLFGLTSDTAENPEDLPWLIRFDKYVDDQTYQGYADLVIRSNSTETAINEAVALELLGLTGLATEEAIATTFTVNGGETELRLAIEHPDEIWVDANFESDDSALYKADSEGDYSYRGDDPEAYEDVFDQKAGDDDLEPLIDLLEFINTSDDDTFASELAERLDIEAFATYLAYQDLVGNNDDIDGRGNNSYLYYDEQTEQFTVVNWDLNLAFNTANVGGGGAPGVVGGAVGRPAAPQADLGEQAELPAPSQADVGELGGRPAPPQGDVGELGGRPSGGPADAGPGAAGSNVLVERFMANDEFVELYNDATTELTELLYSSGAAAEIVDAWVDVLSEQATDLVDTATIEAEAQALLSWIEAH